MQTAQSSIEKIEEASVRRQTDLERDMLDRWLQADLQFAIEEAKKYEWVCLVAMCLIKVYVVQNF